MNIYCGGQLLIQMYKFITITADNASNNRMMMASPATRLCCTDPVGDYDSDCSTIHCLAHVIHLSVMDLLVNIKAVAKWEVSDSPINVAVTAGDGLCHMSHLSRLRDRF